jgi:vacuolar-type H+-ATPase subunit E/Vma4
MAKKPIFLPQEVLDVDGIKYKVTAMSATEALDFMEKHLQSEVEAAQGKVKVDLAVIKKTVGKYVCQEDGTAIDDNNFDVIFARKIAHLQRLFTAVLEYNFSDDFQESDSEE